jgi:cellulose synthase/poly-beta-1,6-N-acetylglucosamine synthase-like glycosyltransferase
VIERVDPVHRGKGFALDYAFRQLKPMGFDAILVVDADSTVGSNFIVATGEALRGRAAAVQARYLTANPHESPRTRLMDFALRAFNFVRPLGREHLGVSAGILGNGFGLRAETLAAVPYLTSSVAEDLEYHVALARSGRRVRFIDETTVLGHMPVSGAGAKSQRARWEGGRLRVLFSHAIPLLGDIFRGRLGSLEPLLDLATLPLAFHVLLLVFAAITPVAMVRSLALVGIAIVLLHLGVTIALGTTRRRDIQTLASAPGYILWKLLLIPLLLRSARSDQPWVRTSRDTK